MTELPNPKLSGKKNIWPFFLHDSRFAPSALAMGWMLCHPVAVLFFSKSVHGVRHAVSSRTEEPQKYKWCSSTVERVHLIVQRTHATAVGPQYFLL